MVEVSVEEFRQRVREILPGVKSYATLGNYGLEWKSDNKLLRILYATSKRTKYVIIFDYAYLERNPLRTASATARYGSGTSHYRIQVGSGPVYPNAEFELTVNEIPNIFTDGDNIFSFIENVRDNGIQAFISVMESLANKYAQSFTIRV